MQKLSKLRKTLKAEEPPATPTITFGSSIRRPSKGFLGFKNMEASARRIPSKTTIWKNIRGSSLKGTTFRKLKGIEEKVKAMINPELLGKPENDLYLRWLQTVRR
jgi:hypothetical protein